MAGTMFFLFLLVCFICFTSYFIVIYNGLVSVKNSVKRAWSNIDVLLKQRHDEIPKLVKVCERYLKHEQGTLENVTKARNMVNNAKSSKERGRAENLFSETLKTLFAVVENYPELKADKHFTQLQSTINSLEREIADRRELFNDCVTIYNNRIEKLPDVFVAQFMGYKEKELWKIDPEDRKDIEINFS